MRAAGHFKPRFAWMTWRLSSFADLCPVGGGTRVRREQSELTLCLHTWPRRPGPAICPWYCYVWLYAFQATGSQGKGFLCALLTPTSPCTPADVSETRTETCRPIVRRTGCPFGFGFSCSFATAFLAKEGKVGISFTDY